MTRDDLDRSFEGLGIRSAHVVVHAALAAFGAVEGGAVTICLALLQALGDNGTLVMPAFTYAETLSALAGGAAGGDAGAGGAAVGAGGFGARGRIVPFHPELPVSREVGPIAEAFRHLPGVLRSSHPTHSFTAWGRQAREVLSTQRDNNPLGPLKKLNVMQGHVVLLGTSMRDVTAVHLAEERFGAPYVSRRTAVRVNAAGYDERVVLENVPGCSAAFEKIEERLDPAKVRSVPLPAGVARRIPIRYLVQVATGMLGADPGVFICEDATCASCAGRRDAVAHLRRA